MANTFAQLYIHILFAVKGRANAIQETYREHVQRYITGIVQNRKAKVPPPNGGRKCQHLLTENP